MQGPRASDYQREWLAARVPRGRPVSASPGWGPVPTPADILGPFYRPGAPWRRRLVPVDEEVNLVLAGRVLTTGGQPVVGYVEFWQADGGGRYDADGNGLRGIQKIGEDGGYEVLTVRPGFYDISEPTDPEPHLFRCPHVHVKVWARGRDVLTTQLYFPDEKYNDTDQWFDAHRVIKLSAGDKASVARGEFDLIIQL